MASFLLPVYFKLPIRIVRGEGFYLFDDTGKEYLDFGCGIAVTSLGHNNIKLNRALENQLSRFWHCSNLFTVPDQERLAARLVDLTFADYAFFCSSGLEALECAIKIMRKQYYDKTKKENGRIIVFKNGFHGRSIATLSAGGNEIARRGFGPLLDGFDQIEAENIDLLKAIINENTAGILIETVQSEGGVYPISKDFLYTLRSICYNKEIPLCFDEVQTGFGRTGSLFDYQLLGIEPDLITCAKAMGNGFPLACCLVKKKFGDCITPGTHGSTYGGNPLAMTVGNAVIDIITEPGFFDRIPIVSEYFLDKLNQLKREFPDKIIDVRGRGMLIGFETTLNAREIVMKCIENGLIVTACASNKVIRILPPLQIDNEEVDIAIKILRDVIISYESKGN